MARRRRPNSPRPLGGVSPPETRVTHEGRPFFVRRIPGASAQKVYVCPWCEDRIPVGEPHVVAWPAEERDGLAQRRHWHSRCWDRGH